MGYAFGTILLVLGVMMRFVGGKADTESSELPTLGSMLALAGVFTLVLGTP
jgi:drug/metabolite transporter (DMT)-like permease